MLILKRQNKQIQCMTLLAFWNRSTFLKVIKDMETNSKILNIDLHINIIE